jgi:hypothetical protein
VNVDTLRSVDPTDPLVTQNKIVIVVGPGLAPGMAANRCAVLATGIAARHPEILGADVRSADGQPLAGITKVPIAVLAVLDLAALRALEAQARRQGCATWVYLGRAQGVRSYEAYCESVAATPFADLDMDAIALYGSRKAVARVTGSLPMFK